MSSPSRTLPRPMVPQDAQRGRAAPDSPQPSGAAPLPPLISSAFGAVLAKANVKERK